MLRTKRKRFEEDEDAESMNERRSENERRDNEKLFELLESTHLVIRDKRGSTHISQIPDELVKRMSEIKNENDGMIVYLKKYSTPWCHRRNRISPRDSM